MGTSSTHHIRLKLSLPKAVILDVVFADLEASDKKEQNHGFL